jgi:hypothetical protein
VSCKALTLDDVLDVLKISRATWYRRLEALKDWETEAHSPDSEGAP